MMYGMAASQSPLVNASGIAVLGDSVRDLHARERALVGEWLTPLDGSDLDVVPIVREGTVSTVLLEVAREADAGLVVVGHHPAARFSIYALCGSNLQLDISAWQASHALCNARQFRAVLFHRPWWSCIGSQRVVTTKNLADPVS